MLAGGLLIFAFVMLGIAVHAPPYFVVGDDGIEIPRQGKVAWTEISAVEITTATRFTEVRLRLWSRREVQPQWWKITAQPQHASEIILRIAKQGPTPDELSSGIRERCPDGLTIACS